MFSTFKAFQSEVKLGTCEISKTTKHYHVFIYDMDLCMTDIKSSRWSKFIQSRQRNVVRFSLDAFLFYGMLIEDNVGHVVESELYVFMNPFTVSSKVITSKPWIMKSDMEIVKGEQTTPFMTEEVGTGFVEVITTPTAEIGPCHFVPDPAVVEEEVDKFVEPRRIVRKVFGLD
ncbi:hypothetical protein cypCar_00024797 [Cyprinus carpio]|nr:hypothetical protein cypCar_00024797 [Cyprinus carpio]